MSELKIVFVDDQPSSIRTLIKKLSEAFGDDFKEEIIPNFEDAKDKIFNLKPQVVVLDLFQGGVGEVGDNLGTPLYRELWEHYFCPIVIFSAEPDAMENDNHPFVKFVQKGAGNEKQVVSEIEKFLPQLNALNLVRDGISLWIGHALRDTSKRIFDHWTDDTARVHVLTRTVRRRIAALMDEPIDANSPYLEPWEHYICPPLGECLLMGDVLRRIGGAPLQPESHYVVLTPSCDLENNKVENVLLAKFVPINDFVSKLQCGATREKIQKNVKTHLSSGFGGEYLPFPELKGVFPQMAANLKELLLVPIVEITDQQYSNYNRVASVDSPFRELIAWAYLQNAGRPGLPTRDFKSWAETIASEVCPSTSTGKDK